MSASIHTVRESLLEELTAAYLYEKIIVVEAGVNKRLFENLRTASP